MVIRESYNYNGNIISFLLSSIATFGLGLLLLIPLVNNYILEIIIQAETGVRTRYYYRKLFGERPLWRTQLDAQHGGDE